MTEVYIGIGGNLGERRSNILEALNSLSDFLTNMKCSEFYRTNPMDYLDQDYFLNMVVRGNTELSPLKLLEKTQMIESNGGRSRTKKIPKGPRTIDLDILLYGREILKTETLIVPHPSMNLRRFVLIPLLEIDGALKDPNTGFPLHNHLEKIEMQGVYCYSLNSYNNLFL